MKASMFRVALVAGAALAAMSPALANHSWGGYHWAGNGQDLRLKVNTSIGSQWNTSVSGSIADWNSSTELTLTAQTASGINPRRCNPVYGQILVCSAAYGQRGWLGLASIWLSNGHIVQAVTQLNDSYHNYAPYNSPAWRSLVACQEVGHDFGLDHQDENFDNVNLGTCMDYTRSPSGGIYNGFNYGPANTHPNAHDYDELKIIYNHNDGYTSATFSTGQGSAATQSPAMTEAAGLSMAEWGRPIRRDSLGRSNVFVKDVDRNHRILTHVLWAPGERER